jgi:DNA repair exonuclease SbcCD ATPase subunit
MSQEEVRRLKAEVSHLRKENQQLKVVAGWQSARTNGHSAASQEKPDPILNVLQNQLKQIKRANQAIRQAQELFLDAERSLETLIPALELQMKGWISEIHQLQDATGDAETAYAEVVARLEQQMRHIRRDLYEKEQALERRYQAEIASLTQELQALRAQPPAQDDAPAPESPWTLFQIRKDSL